MKYPLTILLFASCCVVHAEKPVLTADSAIPIPKLSFDAKGELQVTASASSSASDFDFLVGKWKMHNRRLNKRLEGCQEWTEFESDDENSKILSGTADMDTYSTTEMPGQEGKLFEGPRQIQKIKLRHRLFSPRARARGRGRDRIVGQARRLPNPWDRQLYRKIEQEHDYDGGNVGYFFTAIEVEYCVSSHISFNTPSAAVFSTLIKN